MKKIINHIYISVIYKLCSIYEWAHLKFHRVHSSYFFSAWLEYYDEINISKDHNIDEFLVLAKKWGVPDIPNPHPEGVQEHYHYHPQGLLISDAEKVLTPISTPLSIEEDLLCSIGHALDKDVAREKALRRFTTQTVERQDSLCIIAICIYFNCKFERLKNVAHPDDVRFIITEALLEGQYERYNIKFKDVLKAALYNKLIDKKTAKKILNTKLDVLKMKKEK